MPIIDVTNIVNSKMEPLIEGSIDMGRNPIKIKRVMAVIVHTKEGYNIPHFHIERDRMNDCCIMLNDNRFFNHGDNDSLLTGRECILLDEWLRKVNKSSKFGYTNWQVLADMWNSRKEIQIDLNNQPDYSSIKPYKD